MRDEQARWRLLVPLILLFLSMAACGGFQVRVTPSPEPPTATPEAASIATAAPTATKAAPTKAPSTTTPTAAPTSAPAAQPAGLAIGGTAKVTAGGGLNVRDKPTRQGKQVGKLNVNTVITLTGGPTQADSFTWWEIENGSGLKGWVASGTASETWLQPQAPAPASTGSSGSRLVNRPIKVGDRVQVTTDPNQILTVRGSAGLDGVAVARALRGTEFAVTGGPIRENEMLWWQLEGEKGNGWAAEGKGEDRWLTPIE